MTSRTVTAATSRAVEYPPRGPGSERTQPRFTNGPTIWGTKPAVVPSVSASSPDLSRAPADRTTSARTARSARREISSLIVRDYWINDRRSPRPHALAARPRATCEAGQMNDGAIVIKDVSHVSIGVSDMTRSIAFYRDVFGWEQIFDEQMEGAAFEALTGVPGASGRACGGRIGSLRVELMHFNFIPDTMPPSGLGLRVLSMEVADAHAAHDEVVARGVPVSGPPVEVFGVHMFFVMDPDGQGIEMCEYVRGGPAWGGAYR